MTLIDVVTDVNTVTLKLGTNSNFKKANITVYNPYSQIPMASGGTPPPAQQSYFEVSEVSFQVSDTLMLVQINSIAEENTARYVSSSMSLAGLLFLLITTMGLQ